MVGAINLGTGTHEWPIKTRAECHGDLDVSWYDGETHGRDVFDDGSWSEDQPTGILTQDGEMIYRCRNRMGFRLWEE